MHRRMCHATATGRPVRFLLAVTLAVAVAACANGTGGGPGGASAPGGPTATSAPPEAVTASPGGQGPTAPSTPAASVDPDAFTVRTFYTTYAPDALFGVDAAGNVYLPGGTDGAALVKIGPDGAPLAPWAGTDTIAGVPDTVGGVAIDGATGDVWVTDMTADSIVRLSSDLVEQERWGTSGREPGMLTAPAGIALDAKGNLVVVDMGNSRVETFKPDGTFVREISMPPGVSAPTDVAVAPDGTLLVSAAGSRFDDGRVLRLRPDGSVMRPYRASGASWLFPDAFADVDGGALVADAWLGIVKVDADGKEVSRTLIPGAGDAPVSARLGPSGSVYTLACKVAVTDCTLARMEPDGDGYVVTPSTMRLREPSTPPGEVVNVNGHNIHVFCTGIGSPTILWISGNMSGGWATAASYLLGRLSTIGRVCTVDRLETGFSARPTGEEDMLGWMADLDDIHAALSAAGESGPYVTVGHSYGGLLARVFAYEFPSEVHGVVAIDPSHEDQYDGPVAMPGGPQSCVDASCPFYEDVKAVKQLNDGNVEGSLGALPLVVIGHDRSLPFFDATYDDYWLALGADTATASSNAVHVIATGSSHAVPFTQPGLVVEAATQVVAAARASDHTLPACGTSFTSLGGTCD